MRIADGPSGAVYFLDRSDWGGGKPELDRGLVFASSRLSLLLVCMAVSLASFNEVPGSPTSVMWIKEKPIRKS